ncbi:MAG: S8 family serine peptidase [Bacteriovoracaceae bacterium]|nr:S8 family serine peptidase [Bacteriovoracaceae bacterium]
MKLLLGWMLLFSVSATEYNPNRLLIKADSPELIKQLKNQKRIQHLFSNWYVAYTEDVIKLESELSVLKTGLIFERDYRAQKKALPKVEISKTLPSTNNKSFFTDPKADNVWSFRDASDHGSSIDKAYQGNFASANEQIIVAVVDTGIDYNHEDLKDVMWSNPGEIPNNNIDDDNNGYVDDVHGINTLKRDDQGIPSGDMMDTHSHGSHVSGTIGAAQNNGVGIAGIASNVRLMGLRTVPNSGDELDVDVVESFIYAAKNGARIINCSFGKDRNEGGQAVKEAIDFIGKTYGTLVVAAAGNSSRDIDTRLTYPASYTSTNLLVIGSTTSNGRMSYFSNYGSKSVDLAAPGSNIYSTTPGNSYGNMSGTSMASPTAAGIAAEVLSRHPLLTPEELKEVLMKTVTKSRRMRRSMASQGRIDLFNALNSL